MTSNYTPLDILDISVLTTGEKRLPAMLIAVKIRSRRATMRMGSITNKPETFQATYNMNYCSFCQKSEPYYELYPGSMNYTQKSSRSIVYNNEIIVLYISRF